MIDETTLKVPEVAQAIDRAKRRERESGEHWGVWVDPECQTRVWVSPCKEADEGRTPPGLCVFNTADGELV